MADHHHKSGPPRRRLAAMVAVLRDGPADAAALLVAMCRQGHGVTVRMLRGDLARLRGLGCPIRYDYAAGAVLLADRRWSLEEATGGAASRPRVALS